MKTALITGITGQDGGYLAEFLLEKDYEVHGLIRRSASPNLWRLKNCLDRIKLIDGDLTDQTSLIGIVDKIKPDEIYNLAGQSFVPTSWTQPIHTADINALGVNRLLEAIKIVNPKIKFFQASTSEMFGKVESSPQNELTPFHPRSPYGISKVYAHYTTINYRESYGIFACSGIMFNHESPRRGDDFVSKRIVKQLVAIAKGKTDKIILGNLDAKRDWGYAPDYMEAAWLILQQENPDDYVIATGVTHSVREFVEECKNYLILKDITIEQDSSLYRPAEVYELCGNANKIYQKLGWKSKTGFKELIKLMVDYELGIMEN